MRPAFATHRSAAGFVLLVVVLLAFPWLAGRAGWTSRAEVHVNRNWLHGPFPWVHSQIHGRQGPVDVALLGSSRLWAGFRARSIEAELEKRLGRKAEVVSLGWNWAGFDGLRAVASDLLAHRKVGMIVVIDEFDDRQGAPHPCAHLWTPPGAEVEGTKELPWPDRLRLAAAAPLSWPRFLLTTGRPWHPFDSSTLACARLNGQNPAALFDHLLPENGSLHKEECAPADGSFEPSVPSFGATKPEVLRFGPGTASRFAFTGPPSSSYQRDQVKALARLCREKGTKLVAVSMPVPADRTNPAVRERENLSDLAGEPVTMIGVPGQQLFEGLTEDQVRRLYYDPVHLNANGADRLTALIAPVLAGIYQENDHAE